MEVEIRYKYWDKDNKRVTSSVLPEGTEWYHEYEYRRYTQKGTGPVKAMYKVGNVLTLTHISKEYIQVESPYSKNREHIGGNIEGDTVDCVIERITQRRNFNGGMKYYDVFYKIVLPDGSKRWTTGGKRMWEYIKVGKVTLVDDIQEALWYKMSDEDKKEYLAWEGDLLSFVTRGEVVVL